MNITCNRKWLIGLVLIMVALITSVSVSAQLTNFQHVASNQFLNLYINELTTEVAVEDVATGKLWFTNPQDRAATTRGTNLERLNAQFTIIHDPDEVQKNNYRFSVQYEQFEIETLPNGVRVNYQIVEDWKPEHYLPKMIAADRMEELIVSAIEREADQKRVLDTYSLVMLAPLAGKERRPITALDNLDDVFTDYDLVVLGEDHQSRVADLEAMKLELATLTGDEKAALERSITQLENRLNKEKDDLVWRLFDIIKGSRLDIESADDITHSDVEQLINNPTYLMGVVPVFLLGNIQQIVAETGYSPIEAAEDHELNNLDPALPNLEVFTLALEYVLDGKSLVVRIPGDSVTFPEDVEDRVGEKFTFPLLKISLLEYFGSGSVKNDGYMLVPDGSGALIYLNNDRLFTAAYNEPVYGRDLAHEVINEMQLYRETIRLPVFGLKQDDQAIFAIIEEGASLARIRADISGRIHDYNRVYAEFTLRPKGEISYDLGDTIGGGRIPTYQARMYDGDIVIRYAFLTDEDSTYVGMANFYRNYLIESHGLSRVSPQDNIPFYLELVGAIDKRKPILGVARNVTYPLTSFAEAQSILETLAENGINNIQVKYTGWLNGGINHEFPNQVRVDANLGGEAKLKELIAYSDDHGHTIYPSVGFLKVYRDSLFSGFKASQDASRFLNRLIAVAYKYYLDTFERNPQVYYYILSPARIGALVDSFLTDYARIELDNLALFDVATEVHSDFIDDVDKVINREESVAIIEAQLEKMQEQGLSIMVDGGNAYTLPYVDSIVNLSNNSSPHNIINESIPFYQLVVHGLVRYTGEAINFSADKQTVLLKMLETGGYPYFMGSYKESFEVKNTEFDHLYALHYRDWLQMATDIYQIANTVLYDVQDQLIVDHVKLSDGVYKTSYENGKSIIVNYNWEAVTIGNQLVAGKDFIVLEGQANEN